MMVNNLVIRFNRVINRDFKHQTREKCFYSEPTKAL